MLFMNLFPPAINFTEINVWILLSDLFTNISMKFPKDFRSRCIENFNQIIFSIFFQYYPKKILQRCSEEFLHDFSRIPGFARKFFRNNYCGIVHEIYYRAVSGII